MIGQFSQLWKMFIRPTRQEYTMQDLGFEIQVFKKFKAKRIDLVILNKKGLKLQCSLFEPIALNPEHNKYNNDKYPCVVYCHCNSGSRMEAIRLVPDLIDRGVALFCFDFSGSGLSEGEYVTLGVNESHDLESVIEYLQDTGKISNIALWGRSMGAVTTFIYTSKNSQKKPLKGIVFDSGFSNLNFLAKDLAKQKTGMPNLIIEPALYLIKDQVKERVELNIQDIDLAKLLHHMYIPVYFVCSKEDTFVKCEHSEQLFHRYNGQKWLSYVSGNHNAPRSSETIAMLADWISNLLFERNQDQLEQQQKGQSAFPRKNTLTAVGKIDLTTLQSPQQSQQQQQRKGSFQISPGLPQDQQKSPRPQAYNSSQPSPSVRIDSRSVSPISLNPLKQDQFGVTSAQVLQNQQQYQLQQQISAHGVATDKITLFGTQQKQQEQFHGKSQLPPTLNIYSPKGNNTKSPQLSPTVGGYSSVSGNQQQQQQPFKLNLQAAPQSPQAGGNHPIMFTPYVSPSQQSNLIDQGKLNQMTGSPTVQQKQQDQSNKQQQQYYQTQQPDPLKQAEDQRLSLKQQSIIDQLMFEKTSQSQQESMSSQSRLPTEENSSIGGNQGNCGARGNSAQHGYSFLSNPNEELISYDRNSTPSRKSPLGPVGMPGSSNPQIKLEESSQDSNNSSKPNKRSSDSQQFGVLYEQVDEKNLKSNNANFSSFTLLNGDAPYQQQQTTEQQQQQQQFKHNNKIQVAPIIVSRSNQPNEEGSGTPQFRGEKRNNIFLQAEDSSCNSPGIIAQEQPLESLPLPLQYTNTRNLSHFSLSKQTTPKNAQNNQDIPQSDHPNRFSFPSSSNNPNGLVTSQEQQQYQSQPSQPKPEQSLQSTQSSQQSTNLHRSVRSSTFNTLTSPTHSSTNTPSSNNNNNNNINYAGNGANVVFRQRNAELSKSEIPLNIGDFSSPKLAYQASAPLNKENQPSSSSNSTFSQATQQQDFLSIKSNFLSSYSHAVPNAPLAETIPSNNLSGNIRVRPQNNSLDITNNLGFIQDLSKNPTSGQVGYLGGANFQGQPKTNKFNTFSTSKAQETSAALAAVPLITQDNQKSSNFDYHTNNPQIFISQGKTSSFGANQKQTTLNTSNSQIDQPSNSVSQQALLQQQQDKKNQVKTVGISIISPRQQQQSQQSEQQLYQPFFPADSSSRVSTEKSSYSSANDQSFKFQNHGKDEVTIRKDSGNSKDIAQENSLCNTPQVGTSHNGVSSNSAQTKINQDNNPTTILNSNNYNTNPAASSSSANDNIPKNPNTGFSLGPSKYFTTYDGQSYPQQGYQKPSQQPQQPPQQSFTELSSQIAFATQVSPIPKQTYSVANTPKIAQSLQQQQQRQPLQFSGSSQPSRSYFEATLPSSSIQSTSNQQTKSYNTNSPYNPINNNSSNKNNNSNFTYQTFNPQNISSNNFPSNNNASYSGSSSNSQPAMPMTSSKGLAKTPEQLKQQLQQQSQQKYNLNQGQSAGTSGSNVNHNNNSSSSNFFGLK